MTRARALLLGLGQIGCGYDSEIPFHSDQPRSSLRTLSHARALACHPGFELVAGIDPCAKARQRFSLLYEVPVYSDISSWRATSSDPPPDLVVIAVPAQVQLALVQNLLQITQPQLLLLEKPVASSLEQARSLQAVCAQHPHLNVAVNYIRTWLPAVQDWRRRLQGRELGSFLYGQIAYGKGLLSNGSHFVNLAEAWLGPLTPGRLIDPGPPCFGFDREASLELLATAHGQAPLLVRSVGTAGLRAGEVDLWFERGRLCWPNNGQSILFWPRCDPANGDIYSSLAAQPEHVPTQLDHYQLEVANSLYQFWKDPGTTCLYCDLNNGLLTFETLASACAP